MRVDEIECDELGERDLKECEGVGRSVFGEGGSHVSNSAFYEYGVGDLLWGECDVVLADCSWGGVFAGYWDCVWDYWVDVDYVYYFYWARWVCVDGSVT